MNLDGLTMSVLAKEINERLQTGQIQKLYQIDKTTLLFKIRALNEDQNLIITVGATPAMYLSQPLQDLPKEPSSLCMFLRKHKSMATESCASKRINWKWMVPLRVPTFMLN